MSKPGGALNIGPIARLSLGLVALLVSLVMLADTFLQIIPDPQAAEQRMRQRVAGNLALQITTLLESGDTVTLSKTLQRVLSGDPSIASISVSRPDGSVLIQRGQLQTATPKETSFLSPPGATDQLSVPVLSGNQVWGDIHIQFAAAKRTGLLAWLMQPTMKLLGAITIGGFLLFYAYLRRAMHYLNPSASVPDRVRTAFDSLTEGLLIVDQHGRIVLANNAFRQLHPEADTELNGQRLDALTWLSAGPSATAPWAKTLQSGEALTAEPLALVQPEGEPTQFLVSCAAITDNRGKSRGCLITFDNVTAVHSANEELRHTLAQLESSRLL
jgi:PAS domain S-box-containing protein